MIPVITLVVSKCRERKLKLQTSELTGADNDNWQALVAGHIGDECGFTAVSQRDVKKFV